MRQTRKAGQIRRRLVAGLFCISLFAADVTTVIPVWASTSVEAGQAQGVGEEASQSAGLTQKPDEGNMGDDTQDSGDVQSPDDGKGGDGEQDSGAHQQNGPLADGWNQIIPQIISGEIGPQGVCDLLFGLFDVHRNGPFGKSPAPGRDRERRPMGGRIFPPLLTGGERFSHHPG